MKKRHVLRSISHRIASVLHLIALIKLLRIFRLCDFVFTTGTSFPIGRRPKRRRSSASNAGSEAAAASVSCIDQFELYRHGADSFSNTKFTSKAVQSTPRL